MIRRFYPPTASDVDSHAVPGVYKDIHHERVSAHQKHDSHGGSMERLHWQDESWLPVVTEELGEAAKELNELRHDLNRISEPGADPVYAEQIWGAAYTDRKEKARAELVQVAAMVTAWIEAIDEDRCGEMTEEMKAKENNTNYCCRIPFHGGQHMDWTGKVNW